MGATPIMRRRHIILALLVPLLLQVPAVSAWAQLHGDAGRSGLMPLPDGPLDVVGRHQILPDHMDFNALHGLPLVQLGDGLIGVARIQETAECILVRTTVDTLDDPLLIPVPDCHAPWFQGVDPASQSAFVCGMAQASQPVLQALDATTGALRWSINPSRDLDVVDEEASMYWGCTGMAMDLDARVAVAIFINAETGVDVYRHRVAMFDLDSGAVIWVSQIPRSSEFTGGIVTGQPIADGPAAGLIPLTATMTATGILTTGVIVCADVVTCDQPSTNEEENFGPFMTATAWMTRDGEVQGMASSRFDRRSDDVEGDATSRTAGGAFWAASRGALAAISAGGYITLVNPENKDWLASAPVSTLESPRWGIDPFASPIWGHDLILVPFYRTISAFDPLGLEQQWAWATDAAGWIVGDAAVSPTGQVMALATQTPRTTKAGMGLQSDQGMLVRLDGDTGDELQRLPVVAETWMATEEPFGIPEQGAVIPPLDREDFRYPRPPVMMPIDGGMLIIDLSGNAVKIQAADPRLAPVVEASGKYTLPGATFGLTIPGDQGGPINEVYIRWERGDTQRLGNDTMDADGAYHAEHVFNSLGLQEILVTVAYEDGRTRTTAMLVDVVAAPPPPLGLLQRAFLPENQDMTFGILGIVLAVSGGLWAANVRLRRRGWMRTKLRELDAIVERHEGAPTKLRAALEAQRKEIRERALRGQLDEAPLGLLERRIDTLASGVRLGIIDRELPFLPHALARRLQEILVDNRVEEDEMSSFIDAVENEGGLSLEQRLRIEAVVASWFEEDAV